MIARIWHGVTKTEHADEYLAFLKKQALPDYKGTPGNLAAFILRRTDEAITHFITLTHWDSLQSIAAFAGSDIARAKYYPEDTGYLLEFEATVQHFEIFD